MSAVKVVVEDAGPCRKELQVEIPAAEVSAEYRRVLGTYVGAGRIKGFRPGHAPAALVERHYAKQILEDVRDALLARGYREALEQKGIKPVSLVDVGEAKVLLEAPFAFKVTVDVAPQFELPEYKAIPLKGRKVAVGDEDVAKVIDRLRERAAQFPSVTGRPVQKGDLVRIDYEGRCGGQLLAEIAPGCAEVAKGKDFWLMTEGVEFIPGLAAGVEGMEAGTTREIQVAYPADYHVKEVAGKSCAYTVTAHELRERHLPEVTDEFCATMGAESAEALRARVRADLQQAAEREEQGRRRDEIARYLLEKTTIADLPETVVQDEVNNVVRDIVRENTMRGITREQIQERRDDILNAATRSSAERVRLSYILRRIADAEKVEVSDAEVDRQVAVFAARYNMPLQKMRAAIEKRGAIDGIRGDLRSAKTIEYLLAQAAVTVEDEPEKKPEA